MLKKYVTSPAQLIFDVDNSNQIKNVLNRPFFLEWAAKRNFIDWAENFAKVLPPQAGKDNFQLRVSFLVQLIRAKLISLH